MVVVLLRQLQVAVLKRACRVTAAYAAFAATANTVAATASAVLLPLLRCCCAAVVVTYRYLFSVFVKSEVAVLRDANRSLLFRYEVCIFVI